ncbi:serine hydrolase domain-containing protein [Rufibacter hautae]|uniref:Beta-lactamase family protein n=1 Tax=Rufibacter hautae TaxID=2595005 RepID=A0A5B6THP2_9BACT|nr:serine hydrolase domain-containing protein [Rufibacter hautae]KAA3440194.1 beta-lactamase family protein [Rufibacter hautae]
MARILLSLGLVLVFTFSARAQSTEMDALIMPYVQTNNYGGSVLVAQKGKVLFSKAYGQMNRSYNLPNTAQTKFFLASASMIFTSAAIMKLAEEKKLSLDDPVAKYLPSYKHGKRLTLHHLLSQRSGIPAIGENQKVDYDSITKFQHTPEQLIKYIEADSLQFAPDSKYNHGRTDYIVLASIIEKVTGKPFGTYLKETIFTPLKMTNTGHSTGEKEIIPNLANGYAAVGHYDLENAYQINWTSKTGHGSIYSTTEDLYKFATAISTNALLSKESWQKVFTDYGDNVGYGWFIRDHLDRKRVQMNGRSPGFSSYFAIYPYDQLTVIVLSNNYISLPATLGLQLAAVALKKTIAKTSLTKKAVTPEQAAQLVGKYKFDANFYLKDFTMEVSYQNGNLSCSWGALIPVANATKPGTKFIQRTYWSDVEFTSNSTGQIDTMRVDGHKGIKIKGL